MIMKIKYYFIVLLVSVQLSAETKRPIAVNIAPVKDWSTQWIFVDAMKQCRPWIVKEAESYVWSADSVPVPSRNDGYPTHVPFEFDGKRYIVHTLMLREIPGGYPAGDYLFKFAGEGKIKLDFDAAEMVYDSAGTYSVPVTPSESGIHLTILDSDSSNPIHNIKMIMPGFEEVYETEPFHPRLLELLEPFQVARFMPAMGINGGELANWKNRTTQDFYTQSIDDKGGLALEWIIALCNRIGIHPWINVPHLADDNFVNNFAQVMQEKLYDSLKIYIEYSNETWNTAWPYWLQHSYCSGKGTELGLSEDGYQAALIYTVYRSLEIFQIFEEVFQGDEQLVKILASHSANPWTGQVMLSSLTNDIVNPDNMKIDAFAIAPYFGGEYPDRIVDEGLLSTITTKEFLDRVATSLEEVYNSIDSYLSLTEMYGIDLFAYEGGQHLTSLKYQDNQNLIDLIAKANRHEKMKGLYIDYFNYWYEKGGKLFATFILCESYGRYGAFGLIEHFSQNLADIPKWQAHKEAVFNYQDSTKVSIDKDKTPNTFYLAQNYPNPFNSTTTIGYYLPVESDVKISIFNLNGKLIERLVTSHKTPGYHTTIWQAKNLPTGIYFYKIKTNKFSAVKKCLLLK